MVEHAYKSLYTELVLTFKDYSGNKASKTLKHIFVSRPRILVLESLNKTTMCNLIVWSSWLIRIKDFSSMTSFRKQWVPDDSET